jgi:peptide/nickel transport system permease protein
MDNQPIKKRAMTQRTLLQQAWLQFRNNRLAICGMIVIVLLLLISVATLLIDFADGGELYKQLVTKTNLAQKLDKPSAEHILGCDEYGRDMLFRLIWGTRYSLFSGICTILAAILIGGIFGASAGYYGGKIDNAIMRFMDMMMTVPSLVLAMAIYAALGPSLVNLLIALTVSQVPQFARIVRSSVMTVKDCEYVEAARAVGASDALIIVKYIIPNALSPVIVQGTLGVATTILNVAGMSFLGLGIQPPAPEWGSILSSARIYMREAWHISVFPGLAIVICILSLNLLGDGLRDALDPKQKR